MKPLVSVIIPVYNRPELLVRSLQSVASQTIRDLEILVVDDGSTIDIRPSRSELDDPRIQLLQHSSRRGVSSARNTGMDVACGQYVAFLDSDDYWRDRKLERQLAFMGATPNVRPVSCTVFTIKTMRNPDGEPGIPRRRARTNLFRSAAAFLRGQRCSAPRTFFGRSDPSTRRCPGSKIGSISCVARSKGQFRYSEKISRSSTADIGTRLNMKGPEILRTSCGEFTLKLCRACCSGAGSKAMSSAKLQLLLTTIAATGLRPDTLPKRCSFFLGSGLRSFDASSGESSTMR